MIVCGRPRRTCRAGERLNGVSVNVAWRANELWQVPAAVRFLALEPLIGPLPSMSLDGIHWAIGGGSRATARGRWTLSRSA